ncbi:MAG: RimK family alpha-L-glutamate ligase [bacterium]
MRIAILCRDETLHGVRRIAEAARRRRHTVRVLDPYRFLLKVRSGRLDLEYAGRPFGRTDAVLPRLGAGISEHSLALVRHLDASGRLVINAPGAIEIARDKLRTLQLLARNGLPVPRSAFAPDPRYLPAALRAVGGAPVVVKLPRSTQGKGVMRAGTREEAQALADAMWSLERDVILQEYAEEAGGRDLRLFVVGGEAIAAVRRRAPRGAFRSNLHLGGSVRRARITKEAKDLALRACRLCGLEVAGVDFLETKKGLLLLELNAAPGFEGIERATGGDIASRIVDHLEARHRGEPPLPAP